MTEPETPRAWPPAFAAMGIAFVSLAIAGNVVMHMSLPMSGGFAGVGVAFIVIGIAARFNPGIGRALDGVFKSKPKA